MRTQDYTRTIAAGGETTISQPGRHVAIESCTPDVAVRVLIDGPDGSNVKLKQGQKFPTPTPFEQIVIKNETGTSVDVVVVVSDGDFSNDRISGSVTANIVKPQTLIDAADMALAAAATTLILAADATRHSVLIGNLAANTKTFRIGGSTAGAARGAELAPGKFITIEGGGAIYGYNPAGAVESVSVGPIVKD